MSRPALFAAMLSFTALCACGSSAGHGATGAAASSALALTECMHVHGISSFPDPVQGSGGQGFPINSSPGSSTVTVAGIRFSGPAFVAAEKACRMFGGGTSPPPITESQKEGMLARARCIRRHGVPNFPDPTFGPGGSGAGIKPPPGFDPDSPAIQRAREACANVGTSIPGSQS